MVSDDIEREKLSFEVKKWAESSAIEKQKMWASMISIVVPLLVVAATIYATTHAQQRESGVFFDSPQKSECAQIFVNVFDPRELHAVKSRQNRRSRLTIASCSVC